MPQIIVAADRGAAFGEGAVTFRETVNVADFESQHFATQLVERIGWAVEDADQVERVSAPPEEIAAARGSRRISANGRASHVAVAEDPEAAEAPEPQPDERVSVPSPA
ncbi:MAG TPA: hypothetical protein VME22_26750 [Solirubrobacteraceae bacterium]|nr:hypothetical protein [Solirubrobacteraceae bacterium]